MSSWPTREGTAREWITILERVNRAVLCAVIAIGAIHITATSNRCEVAKQDSHLQESVNRTFKEQLCRSECMHDCCRSNCWKHIEDHHCNKNGDCKCGNGCAGAAA